MAAQGRERGVVMAAAFFTGAGILQLTLALAAPGPLTFWALWEALGRGALYFLEAAGLAQRLALSRSFAMVYCLAALTTYLVVLALALGGAPFRFPPSVVVQSLYEVPSCALLLPYLRSREASRVFTRPLL
jgi:hypothetical protein